MTRLILIFALSIGLLGCGQREQQSAVAVAPAVVIEDRNSESMIAIGDPQSGQSGPSKTVAAEQPPQPPSIFEYPPDLTGKVVAKTVTPQAPALTPTEKFGAAPKPRTLPVRISNPEMLAKTDYSLPQMLTVKPTNISIASPPEKVPFDLGRGADVVPAKPSLPIAAGISEKARDVNLPPSMPTLGRPYNERVSLDDPTSEFANAAIIAPDLNVPLKSAEFVKVGLPDPFELGEQVKPKVVPASEPGLNPVPVNPQRVK